MNLKRLLTLVVMWPTIALADNSASIPVVPPLPTLASLDHQAETPLPVSASATPTLPMVQHSKGNSFDLRFATVSYVVDFVYENAVKTPHVIGPDVLADQRQVRPCPETRRAVRYGRPMPSSRNIRSASAHGTDEVGRNLGAVLLKQEALISRTVTSRAYRATILSSEP